MGGTCLAPANPLLRGVYGSERPGTVTRRARVDCIQSNAAGASIALNAWTREATSDADGLVHFEFPWRGQYILHVVYLEKTPGTFAGTSYEAVRHRATATLTVSTGERTQTQTSWQASKPH